MKWIAIAVAAATILLSVVLASRFGGDPKQVDSPLIGKPAPAHSVALLDETGRISLDEMRGEIVVVNFFASWCVPCRREHDDLKASQAAYAKHDVRFIGIAYQDDPENIRAFLDELGRGYEIALDEGSRLAIEFGVFGIPETFFIDRDGIVVAKIFGESDVAVIESILTPMLAGLEPDSIQTGTIQSNPDEQ